MGIFSTGACRWAFYSLPTLALGFWMGMVWRIDLDASVVPQLQHRLHPDRLNNQSFPDYGAKLTMGVAATLEGCTRDVRELVSSSGSVFGRVTKRGSPPISYWYTPDADQILHKFSAWLNDELVLLKGRSSPPPLSSSCTALVNDAYKFIFVKNPKTAGTSVLLFFGGLCDGSSKNKTWCLKVVGDSGGGHTRESAALAWQNYFVFTISRNPFSRAGSAYDYMLGLRPPVARKGQCMDPPFPAFCKDPMVIGRQDRVFQCNKGHGGIHDFYHVEPQHRCTTTENGKLAVDFILRYEYLHQDFDSLLAHLNENRNPGLPQLFGTLGWQQKGPLLKKRDARGEAVGGSSLRKPSIGHVGKFLKDERVCKEGISKHYREDFDVFGFPLPC